MEKSIHDAVTEGIYVFLASKKSLQSPKCLAEFYSAYNYAKDRGKNQSIAIVMLQSESNKTTPYFLDINKFPVYILSDALSDKELDAFTKYLNKISS